MVSYKRFKSSIDRIVKYSNWVDSVYDDYKISLLETPAMDILDSYIGFIEASFDDTDGYVSWWIYECECGKYEARVTEPDGTEKIIKTDKDLYDLLVEIKEEHDERKKS
jgi:hypothetical protein